MITLYKTVELVDGIFQAKFNYTFTFTFNESIHNIRKYLPVEDQDTEVIELCKQDFELKLREFLKNPDNV